jgi:hypothetical protein
MFKEFLPDNLKASNEVKTIASNLYKSETVLKQRYKFLKKYSNSRGENGEIYEDLFSLT